MTERTRSHIIRFQDAARVEYRLQTLIQYLRILCRIYGLDGASDLRLVGSKKRTFNERHRGLQKKK